MEKIWEKLPARAHRVDKLIERSEAIDHRNTNKEKLNMFAEAGYANASFMQRRAMTVQKVFGAIALSVWPEDLLIGRTVGLVPKLVTDTYEERKKYANISLAFPARNTVYGTDDYCYENRELSEEELKRENSGRWSWGHSGYGLEKILRQGYQGIADDAQARMDAMQESGCVEPKKMEFWQSVIVCCRAVTDLAARYAAHVAFLAEQEKDDARREELLRAEACLRKVPARPAETFYEAVQSTWFSYMCNIVFNGTDVGRLDQLLYPYYEKDLAAGKITPEQAQELLDCLWAKFAEYCAWEPGNHGLHPGIMLGGVRADRQSGVNDLTYMCLNATCHVAAPSPKVSLRINDQTPDDLYELAHHMLTSGLMMPDFYNEKTIIEAYGRIGVPFEDAIYFSQSVCEEIALGGICEDCTNEGPHIDLHDLVMRAVRRAAEEGWSFDALLDRVDEEIRIKVASEVEFHAVQTEKLRVLMPQPLHSATIRGCVESGRDIMDGGASYNNTGSVLSGIATAANSLYSIGRLVYEEKRMSLSELIAILDSDFAGEEILRAEILSKFPKYGNDVDDVDKYAVRMFDVFAEELGKYKNSRGGVFKIGAWASEYRSNYQATADGRKRWDSFATNVSPTPGTDQKGATAVIRSATKLGLKHCTAGGMVDVTLSPSCLRGENGVNVLKQLLKAYCALEGFGLQFNLVDSEMLEKALKDPIKYKNLMVRVWGYNDYFVGLADQMKKHILDRTRHEESV